jgi:simple sugar transport system permease protein
VKAIVVFAVMMLQSGEFRATVAKLARRPLPDREVRR